MRLKFLLFCTLCAFCILPDTLYAQHVDEVAFGNTSSETAHGMTTYNPSKVENYTKNGLTAKRFLPDNTNPYQGSFLGTYGGEVSFAMRVDSTRQNYFTIKVSGDDPGEGRIALTVEGKEIGSRHGGNEEILLDGSAGAPGSFFYRTAPIPKSLTKNKSFVTIRLRSTGRYYGYGTAWNYASFQRTLDGPTPGIYRGYMHANPAFSLPSDDIQGTLPSYSLASSTADDFSSVKAIILQRNKDKITALLNGSNSIVTDPNNFYNNIEVMAVAYHMTNNTVAYHNPAVVSKIRNAIDQHVINNNSGAKTASSSWGGAFGRSAYAVHLVYSDLTGLDEVIDLGGGAGLTRRAQWVKIFKESFDFGATHRRIITNQDMEVGMSVYGASLGLATLDPAAYSNYQAIGLRLALESCGLAEFTGSVTNLNTSSPVLGNPASSEKGAGYYYMTQKGTSHEPGWVAPDCYGNLAPKILEFYHMTKSDSKVIVEGAGNGDSRFLQMAIKHTKIQSAFTYPWVENGKRAMLSEGAICWRNVYIPGHTYYGNPLAAAETLDPVLLGYTKQMAEDGHLSHYTTEDPRGTWMHYLPDALDKIASASSGVKLPSTPGQPDYVVADEENGVLGVKRGDEQLFVNLYMRAYSDNNLAKAHFLTPQTERLIELNPEKTEYFPSGKTVARTTLVLAGLSGDAPDKPVSAYGGQIENMVSYNRGSSYHSDRQLKDFYQVQVGKYLIAMNTTRDLTKTMIVPAALVGKNAYEVGTGNTTLTASMSILPATTKVYYIEETSSSAGLIADNTPAPSGVDKTALTARVSEMETFATASTTVEKVSVSEKVGNYKYNLFDIFIRKLTVAKYATQYDRLTQAQTDLALSELNTAYTNLVGTPYLSYDPYQRLEAENYSTQSGIQTEANQDEGGGRSLSFVDAGDYTSYSQLDFKQGATKFYIRYAMPTTPATVELRTGSPTGPLAGKINLAQTGGYGTWKTDSCKVSGISGVQNLFLVFRARTNVNWFKFDSVKVSYLSQILTFPTLPAATLTTADFDPGASASSGLAVSYTSSNTNVATIVNNKVHIVGAGTATITAIQPGDWTYDGTESIQQVLIVAGQPLAGDYVSTGTMNWSGGTWNISDGNGGYSGTSTAAPVSTKNVWILNGHAVTLNVSSTVKNFTLQSGGALSPMLTATTGSANTTLTISGEMVMNGSILKTTATREIISVVTGDVTVGGSMALGGLTTNKNLYILETGKVFGTTVAGGTVQGINFNGASPTILVNGQLGGPGSNQSGESIRIFCGASGTTTFTGTGKIFIARYHTNGGATPQNFVIDANFNVGNNANGAGGLSLVNGTGTKTLTINAGKTFTLSHANAAFHGANNVTETSVNTGTSGDMIYNINGTLDVSKSPFVIYANTNPNQEISVNVGSGGVLKLGANVRMAKAYSTQKIGVNVADGGTIDASATALNLTTAPVSTNSHSSNGTGACWFGLAPKAVYKRLVTANVNTPFWIGTPGGDYNPVDLKPAINTVYTVGVITEPRSNFAAENQAVQTSWKLSPSAESLTGITIGYNANQANPECDPAATMILYRQSSLDSTWTTINSTATPVTGNGTDKQVVFNNVSSSVSDVNYTFGNYIITPQAITFSDFPEKKTGDGDFTPPATASSGLQVNYTSSDTTVAKILQNTIRILKAGSTVITASQPGNLFYSAAPQVSKNLVIKDVQTITFSPLTNKTIGDADFDAEATSSSGLPVSYTSSDSTIATVINNQIHIIASGSAVITASQSGNNVYLPANSVSQTLNIAKKPQTITFASLLQKEAGDTDFEGGATASSGLEVIYSSSNTDVATIVDGKIHIIGSGTSVITASQSGNAVYTAASSVSQTLTVHKKDQTIAFAVLPQKKVGDPDFNGEAVASSGLPILYSSSNTAVATIVNGDIHIVGAGVSIITATQAGDNVYVAADSVSQALTVNKREQSITFAALTQKTIGNADFDARATASSGLPVSYVSSNESVATIVNNQIHIVGAGSSTITALQTGNAEYFYADNVSQILTVQKKEQSITFTALAEKTVGDADFDPGAVSSSGLAMTYTSSNTDVAVIINGKIHLLASGTTLITAIQEGDLSYEAAQSVSNSLVVKRSQFITFNPIAAKLPGDADADLLATSSSGLPVSYSSSNIAVAEIINGKIHITGVGNTTIIASQAGNSTYTPATSVSQSLTVNALNLVLNHLNSDYSQPSNNVIKPDIKLINNGTVALAYSQLTIRYWFTAENYAGINTWVDYAQIGNSKVKLNYVQINQPKAGANGYVEYSFDPSAGNLQPGGQSGSISTHFANKDWGLFNETDDHSLVNTSSYASNARITVYRNGMLVWGTEPQAVSPLLKLSVLSENKNSNSGTNTISNYMKISNEGNIAVAYEDLSVRYWFMSEGLSPLNYWTDYAKLGNSNITSQFIKNNQSFQGADTYLEFKVKPAAGTLYPLSNSGNIQFRITKSDWSNFNELNDYSYKAAAPFAENAHITVYYKGQLVFGTEPQGYSNGLAVTNPVNSILYPSFKTDKPAIQLYPNPVSDILNIHVSKLEAGATVKVYNTGGIEVYSQRLSGISHTLSVAGLPSGVYVVQITNGTQIFRERIIKQ